MDGKGGGKQQGGSNPISRKIFGRVKEMLLSEPATKVPDVDHILDMLCDRYADCKRIPRNNLRRTLVDNVMPNIHAALTESVEGSNGVKKRRRGGDGEESSDSGDEESGARLVAYIDKNRANSGMQKVYQKHAEASASDTQQPSAADGDAAAPAKPGRAGGGRANPQGRRRAAEGGAGKSGGAVKSEIPGVRYSDLGGVEQCLQDVRELIEYPLMHPEIYAHLGVEPPRGVLLHGPPGSGKTMLASAVAAELAARDVKFFRISAPEVVSGMSGESEATIRELFATAKASAPALVFIDEIDAITPKRENAQREMERRIVAQLLTCMDDLGTAAAPAADSQQALAAAAAEGADEGTARAPAAVPKSVMVIGATNRPDSLDPALRRAGRFDREICMGVPDEKSRLRILAVLTSKLRLSGDFDLAEIARRTPGFVGADLAAVSKEAAALAVNRIFKNLKQGGGEGDGEVGHGAWGKGEPLTQEELEPLSLTMCDFEEAVGKVQPSAKREGFATIPDVTWDDIGALDNTREELSLAICEPIKRPEKFEMLGLKASTGVLLYGPPGCGKTLLAKAVARESGANFIAVKGPELLNKFVGESERAVRQLFSRAQASSPCVVFFDELDALCPKRGGEGGVSSERVVNQLLTEMDGLNSRQHVYVIAATNRPDMIDGAMLRPGRLDKLLYVPLPQASERLSILRTIARKMPIADDVDLETIAVDPRAEGFSGADCAALLREAAMCSLRADLTLERTGAGGGGRLMVERKHIDAALKVVLPSVSRRDEARYKMLSTKIRQSRAHVEADEGEKGEAEKPRAPEGGPGSAGQASA